MHRLSLSAVRGLPALPLAFAAALAAAQPAPDPVLEVRGLWRVEQARTEPLYERGRARLDFGADWAASHPRTLFLLQEEAQAWARGGVLKLTMRD